MTNDIWPSVTNTTWNVFTCKESESIEKTHPDVQQTFDVEKMHSYRTLTNRDYKPFWQWLQFRYRQILTKLDESVLTQMQITSVTPNNWTVTKFKMAAVANLDFEKP